MLKTGGISGLVCRYQKSTRLTGTQKAYAIESASTQRLSGQRPQAEIARTSPIASPIERLEVKVSKRTPRTTIPRCVGSRRFCQAFVAFESARKIGRAW